MTQQQRNQAIITTGEGVNGSNLGKYSGQQCKPWVTSVILTASQNSVQLPATETDGYQWNIIPGDSVVQMSSGSYPFSVSTLQILQPGWILQLEENVSFQNEYKTPGPHTAIVLSISALGVITLLDSNWVATDTIGIHSITLAQFNSYFARYTAYEIM